MDLSRSSFNDFHTNSSKITLKIRGFFNFFLRNAFEITIRDVYRIPLVFHPKSSLAISPKFFFSGVPTRISSSISPSIPLEIYLRVASGIPPTISSANIPRIVLEVVRILPKIPSGISPN